MTLGSPPRMRGKHDARHGDFYERGITPADAGKTPYLSLFSFIFQDHPRGCGENTLTVRNCPADRGSPPRMRGKRQYADKPHAMGRITPADAGKTNSGSIRLSAHRDHPRGCGENFIFSISISSEYGSPPRMRGKHAATVLMHGIRRITPADAGKTKPRLRGFSGSGDHPRGCGENRIQGCCPLQPTGSPPRMRGKPLRGVFGCAAIGITPADAGKTEGVHLFAPPKKDHPRGCGENHDLHMRTNGNGGSPPRMRGKPLGADYAPSESGITPADAGKTRFGQNPIKTRQDHPRGCGENIARNAAGFTKYGSPPRMRGKRFRLRYHRSWCGITPADAGKTKLIYTYRRAVKDHPRGCGENTKKIL